MTEEAKKEEKKDDHGKKKDDHPKPSGGGGIPVWSIFWIALTIAIFGTAIIAFLEGLFYALKIGLPTIITIGLLGLGYKVFGKD